MRDRAYNLDSIKEVFDENFKPSPVDESETQQHIRALFTKYNVDNYDYVDTKPVATMRLFSSKRNDIDADGLVESNEHGFVIARFPYKQGSREVGKIVSEFINIFGAAPSQYCMCYAENKLYVSFSKDAYLPVIIERGKQLQQEREEKSFHKKFGNAGQRLIFTR